MRCVEGLVAGGDGVRKGGIQLAGGDFFRHGGGVAELAVGEIAVSIAQRRAEGAAEDGAMRVEVAGSGGGIEHGTGLVVAEDGGGEIGGHEGLVWRRQLGGVGKERRVFIIAGEDAGGGVAGKVRSEAGDGGGDASAYAGGAGRVGLG